MGLVVSNDTFTHWGKRLFLYQRPSLTHSLLYLFFRSWELTLVNPNVIDGDSTSLYVRITDSLGTSYSSLGIENNTPRVLS